MEMRYYLISIYKLEFPFSMQEGGGYLGGLLPRIFSTPSMGVSGGGGEHCFAVVYHALNLSSYMKRLTIATGLIDTGSIDTGSIDTGSIDTGSIDTVRSGRVPLGQVRLRRVQSGRVQLRRARLPKLTRVAHGLGWMAEDRSEHA